MGALDLDAIEACAQSATGRMPVIIN